MKHSITILVSGFAIAASLCGGAVDAIAQSPGAIVTPQTAPVIPRALGDSVGASARDRQTANRAIITEAQQQLNKMGARLKVDGLLGRETTEAIKKFQSSHGLAATGRLDAATVAALKAQ